LGSFIFGVDAKDLLTTVVFENSSGTCLSFESDFLVFKFPRAWFTCRWTGRTRWLWGDGSHGRVLSLTFYSFEWNFRVFFFF
jgi:hypothetical protein